jgi:hypothetical protein
MEGIAPGTNRRSHHKTLRKFWRWAHDLGHVGNDPMAKLKPLDEWGVNSEILSPALFQRLLRVVQGLEGPMPENCFEEQLCPTTLQKARKFE